MAQKLMKAKKISDNRLLNATAAKKTAAIIHQARTRAASSVKSVCGLMRLSAATMIDATTSTTSTSKPICTIGERLLIVFIRFIGSTSRGAGLRQFAERPAQAIPASHQRKQGGGS